MARYPRNNMHHITTLPLPPHTWPLIASLQISIAHPKTSLCFCLPSSKFLRGGVCVCVCVCIFEPPRTPNLKEKGSPHARTSSGIITSASLPIETRPPTQTSLPVLCVISLIPPHQPFSGIFQLLLMSLSTAGLEGYLFLPLIPSYLSTPTSASMPPSNATLTQRSLLTLYCYIATLSKIQFNRI